MEEKLKWPWTAFSIAWLLHVGSVSLLSAGTEKLEREIGTLDS